MPDRVPAAVSAAAEEEVDSAAADATVEELSLIHISTSDWAASASTTVTGNIKLVATAMAAARKVVSMYLSLIHI